MSSITGMGFSTYTNNQTQRTNTDQTRVTTNTTFGEAFNKAISTPKPAEQVSNSNHVQPKLYSAGGPGDVAIEGFIHTDENGNEFDIRRLAIPEWWLDYSKNSIGSKYPALSNLSDYENHMLSNTLRDILFNKTLSDLDIEAGSDQYVNEVLLDPIRSEEVHKKFWENVKTDDRMEKYVKHYYI
ncbi:hypothetical protein [Nitrincola sp. MINF-07-Sa-05]|uniref:hypothetical protein n=1 Tax=Nitrincola salilacus TaxID=3400273 RepID=UPI0039185EA5